MWVGVSRGEKCLARPLRSSSSLPSPFSPTHRPLHTFAKQISIHPLSWRVEVRLVGGWVLAPIPIHTSVLEDGNLAMFIREARQLP